MQWSISQRPHTLNEMAGAETAKRYFYNLVAQKKEFPQGIVFKGITGSGKTTLSKIVSQMIVCSNPKPNGDPCCECADCRAIIDEKYNRTVLQIDGGNSSKDEVVGTITDFLATSSMLNRPKVVLVEEAQELSSAAQKSLLKLLEIPRKNTHIIFTTMTGNGGKTLPAAIMNRCQRFIFYAAKPQEMMSFLKSTLMKMPEVLEQMPDMSVEQQGEFFTAIAMNANGSYRQGLQLLEQCVDAGVWTAKDIGKEFGITDEASFYQIMLDMLNGKMTDESFETLCGGDANKLQSVFSLSYKVIADAECYRLFGHVPNVDDDNEFFLRQAKEISAHPNFPYMRSVYYEFAQYEKLMPSNIRMLVCKVFDACKTGPKVVQKLEEQKVPVIHVETPKDATVSEAFETVNKVRASFDSMEPVKPVEEAPASSRRVIRR